MPELPEVETVRRGLAPAMVGARFTEVILRRPDLRFPFPAHFAERLRGPRGHGSRAQGQVSAGGSLVRRGAGHASRHVGPLFGGDGRQGNPRRESSISTGRLAPTTMWRSASPTARPSPTTTPDGSASWIWCRAAGSKPAGISPDGHRAPRQRILRRSHRAPVRRQAHAAEGSPPRPEPDRGSRQYLCVGGACSAPGCIRRPRRARSSTARGRPTESAHRLAEVIRDVLNEAVVAGGSTLRDHQQVDGTLGYFQHRFRVYDREGEACVTPACTGIVQRLVQSGRSTFFCPRCQRRKAVRKTPAS